VAAEKPKVDLTRMTLPGTAVSALARAYLHWEAKRYPPTIRDLQWAAQSLAKEDWAGAAAAVNTLLEAGLLEPNGEGEGDRREVPITPLGIAWFEANCDYRRECNVYRYKERRGAIGCFEYDPRRPLGRRLLDPLVAGAAVAGAAFASLLFWMIR